MKKKMIMKEKRFSFFADPQERKAESQPTFGTLPFARHTSQRFAKVKEPNRPLFLILLIILLIGNNAYTQSETINTQNLIGCWQTTKYVTANEEIIYPKEIKMIYKFYCNGTYEMLISNDNTNQSKYQKGKFSYDGKMITVAIDGGEEPIEDYVSFVDANTIKMDVVLENEQGTFYIKRILCE
jgi:hypothetical protein